MKITENTTSVNGESAAVQSATAGPNAQDEPTAESGAAKPAAPKNKTGDS